MIHGNNIGLYYCLEAGETAKVGTERVKRKLITHPVNWLPQLLEEGLLIFSHFHKRFYHETVRMYCTSCWSPTNDSQNDADYIIIINDQIE